MLVGTDVCGSVVFVWEEIGVPGGNPTVWLGDHMTISLANDGYWTRVAAVRGEHVITTPASQNVGIYLSTNPSCVIVASYFTISVCKLTSMNSLCTCN